MWPRTRVGEKKHRRRKREIEMELIVKSISDMIQRQSGLRGKMNILEFGCGDGFQIPYLQMFGHVVASDIYLSEEIKLLDNDIEFYECSIINTPFEDDSFDLIFSNHVIEHIGNVNSAFVELKRIGKRNCIYAFSVPTSTWLVLSIPADYYNKVRGISNKLISLFKRCLSGSKYKLAEVKPTLPQKEEKSLLRKALWLILPAGHGAYQNFLNCLSRFRIKRWKQLFNEHGFKILQTRYLLLYAPSEWPVIPTTKFPTNLGLCSSVLFLMGQIHDKA